jgi:hypothetical protein
MFGKAKSSTKSPLPVMKRRSSIRRIGAPIPVPAISSSASMKALSCFNRGPGHRAYLLEVIAAVPASPLD